MSTPENPGYGQPPPYGQPAPGQTWQPQGTPAAYSPGGYPPAMANGLGIAALVCGVIALPLSLLVVGAVLGVIAIVLGFLGRGRAKRGQASNPGVALAGILTGALSIVVAIAIVLAVWVFATSDTGHKLRHCIDANQSTAAQQQCERDAGIPVVGSG